MAENDYPPKNDSDRMRTIKSMNEEILLEHFANASLKRVVSDTNKQEREWEEYWSDLRFEIMIRMEA